MLLDVAGWAKIGGSDPQDRRVGTRLFFFIHIFIRLFKFEWCLQYKHIPYLP